MQRGSFSVTDKTCEQMEAASYGVYYTFEDDKHLIMGNEEQAFVVAALEAKAKAGEPISLVDLANAIKAEEKGGKGKPKEEKQYIRAQLKKDAGKEKAASKKAATKKKNNDLEV